MKENSKQHREGSNTSDPILSTFIDAKYRLVRAQFLQIAFGFRTFSFFLLLSDRQAEENIFISKMDVFKIKIVLQYYL